MSRDLLKGLLLGGVTAVAVLLAPWPLRVPLVGVLLALAAGVYPGFVLGAESGRSGGGRTAPASDERRVQWIVALLFAVLAAVGITRGAWWLAAGWCLHAGWDLRHHAGRRGDWVPGDYPLFCLAYDLVLAGLAGWLASAGGVS